MTIPDGVVVDDRVGRKRYTIEGGKEVPRPQAPVRPPGLLDKVNEVPGEDWLFYGGFSAAVCGGVAAFRWALTRKWKEASEKSSV